MIRKTTYAALIGGILVLLAGVFITVPAFLKLAAIILIVLSVALITLGVFVMRLSFFSTNICKISPPGNFIALTFDDGPVEETARLLDILGQHSIKASFFCIGKQVEKYPGIVRRIVNSGHTIGSHTYNHSWKYTFASSKTVESEISSGINAISEITGKETSFFRPPIGIENPIIGKVIRKMKLHCIGWNIRTLDTMKSSGAEIVSKIEHNIQPGSIILLHDRLKITVDAIPEIIRVIKEKGLTPVTLEEVLNNSNHV